MGFGDSFLEPLPLEPGCEMMQRGTGYCLTQTGDQWTLSEWTLITTAGGVRQERQLAGEDEWQETLHAHFGVVL